LRSDALARSRKRRNGYEILCEALFRPLAHPLVLVLARLRVPPPVVVVAAGVVGIAGAVELSRGSLLLAAALVQLKTLLDNADGQLARLTGRTSTFGRYLDSEVDLVVNAALFAAIGRHAGMPGAGLVGFVALTLVLSLNFNAARLSRAATAEPETGGRPTEWLRAVYRVVYKPQDRLAEWIVARRPVLTSSRCVSVLANLGMSTQLAVLGACLAFGAPLVFVWIAVGELVIITLALLPQRMPMKKAAVGEIA
jgi:archaetidylinositol phosphate synthase